MRVLLVPLLVVALCAMLMLSTTGVSATRKELVDANFNSQAYGSYQSYEVKEDFGSYGNFNNNLPGNAAIKGPSSNKYLRVYYPAGKVGSSKSGVQFKVPLKEKTRTSLFFSYKVRFDKNFDFQAKGGKLPGLCGGNCKTGGGKPTGYDGFSARLMFREGGKIASYLYYPGQSGEYGEYFYWNRGTAGQRKVKANTWHTLEVRVQLNDIGKSNGRLQAWFDGSYCLEQNTLMWRKTSRITIDTFYFSTFFGGSDPKTWAPKRNTRIEFDDVIVSNTKTYSSGAAALPSTSDDDDSASSSAASHGCRGSCHAYIIAGTVGPAVLLALILGVVFARKADLKKRHSERYDLVDPMNLEDNNDDDKTLHSMSEAMGGAVVADTTEEREEERPAAFASGNERKEGEEIASSNCSVSVVVDDASSPSVPEDEA